MGTTDDFLKGKLSAFLHHKDPNGVCHALEDLPADVRAQAAEIASDPSGISFPRKVLDDLEKAALDSYGAMLHEQDPALGRYPLKPPGSVRASREELTATVASRAARETGQYRGSEAMLRRRSLTYCGTRC